MIKISHKYKTNIGVYKQAASRKAASKVSAKYPNTNVKLMNAKIIMNNETFARPIKIRIKARSENPLLQAIGKHKALVTQEITRVEDHSNYDSTLDTALEKVFEYFNKQESTYADLAQKSKHGKTNYSLLNFLNKALSRPVIL